MKQTYQNRGNSSYIQHTRPSQTKKTGMA